MKKQENKLWNKARYSLEKHYKYICSNPNSKNSKLKAGFINIGIGGIIADVIGIKDIGNHFEPKIEIIAIEVKENLPNYRERHMDQVRRASVFAHKVFLAAPREFKPEEVELAVKERVGLFELNPEKRKLKLIVPSPPFEPSESKIIELMRRLDFFKCTVCNCYWNKNLITIDGYRSTHVFSNNIKPLRFNKFICDKCSSKLFKLHSKDLSNKFAEEWKVKRINKKTEKIDLRTKKLAEKKDISKINDRLSKEDEKIKNMRRYFKELFNKRLKSLNKQLNKVRRGLKSI
ncbi:MAG: hypothetical protein NT009_06185 [Proteobacteria bacterium]|nr:hypothetical protein [Pseudomonadota bacterium]